MFVGICLFAEPTAGKLYEMTIQFIDLSIVKFVLDLPPNYAFIRMWICHTIVSAKYLAPVRAWRHKSAVSVLEVWKQTFLSDPLLPPWKPLAWIKILEWVVITVYDILYLFDLLRGLLLNLFFDHIPFGSLLDRSGTFNFCDISDFLTHGSMWQILNAGGTSQCALRAPWGCHIIVLLI